MTTFVHYGKVAHFNTNNELILEGKFVGKFKSIKEAKEYCVSLRMSDELKEEVQLQPTYLTEAQIALALKEDGEIKPSETMVSSFKTIIETKQFVPVNVLIQLRERTRNIELPGKMDYILQDGSKVAIDIETNNRLNKLIDVKESANLLNFMTKNSKNFLNVVEQILED